MESDLLRIITNNEAMRIDTRKIYHCTNSENLHLATPYQYESILHELCVILGWQGGTRQQVIDEVKRLKALETIANMHGLTIEQVNEIQLTSDISRAARLYEKITKKSLYFSINAVKEIQKKSTK